MCIRNVKPGMKSINIIFIVLEIGKPTTTKDGHTVRRVKVADKTGSIDISVWDEYGTAMQAGDICKLIKGYCAIWKDSLTLYTSKGGEIQRIDDFCMAFVEVPNMSEPNSELVKQQQQRMNGGGSGGGPGGGGGGGGPSQEQQPPEDNSGGQPGHQQPPQPQRSNNVNRSMDPRSGAGGKMTNRNGHSSSNNSGSGTGSAQNNQRHHHQQQQHHHHSNKPYPPKKPLGSQNSQMVGGNPKEGAGAASGTPQQLQGILKR